MDRRFQVQLEEYRGGSTRQSWMKTSAPLGMTRHTSSKFKGAFSITKLTASKN